MSPKLSFISIFSSSFNAFFKSLIIRSLFSILDLVCIFLITFTSFLFMSFLALFVGFSNARNTIADKAMYSCKIVIKRTIVRNEDAFMIITFTLFQFFSAIIQFCYHPSTYLSSFYIILNLHYYLTSVVLPELEHWVVSQLFSKDLSTRIINSCILWFAFTRKTGGQRDLFREFTINSR